MAQRGRKSAQALAIVRPITDHRPPPPEGLTDQQADEWRAIVGRMPSGFFSREMFGLLAAYCQHSSAAQVLAGLIDSFQPEWLVDPDGLARYDKMRLTPQSRYMPNTAARAVANAGTSSGKRPWEAQ
jgi:hypothetical protein